MGFEGEEQWRACSDSPEARRGQLWAWLGGEGRGKTVLLDVSSDLAVLPALVCVPDVCNTVTQLRISAFPGLLGQSRIFKGKVGGWEEHESDQTVSLLPRGYRLSAFWTWFLN